MKSVHIMAVCVDISMKMNNNILKTLFLDYAKKKLSKKQLIYLYIKIHTLDTNTKLYSIMNKWIRNYKNEITRQMIYDI